LKNVRYFQRALESELDRHNWSVAHLEYIPSVKEAVALVELNDEPPKTGAKQDDGKLRWDLLLAMLGEEAREIVRGLMYGAKKYREDPDDPNYRKVTDPKRRFGNAAMRHLVDAINGQDIDADSGVPNLALAAINCLFLRWHQRNSKE
jgi:hypothetical protein